MSRTSGVAVFVALAGLLVPVWGAPRAPADTPRPTNRRDTPALRARLQFPVGLAIDASGRLYVVERAADRIRRIDPSTGAIETIAGVGVRGYSGDGGPAARAMLNAPNNIAIDPAGNIVFSDTGNQRIRRIDPRTGLITTIVGNGTAGYSGDGVPAVAATIFGPYGLRFDPAGNLYFADTDGQRIRRVDAVTGTGEEGDGGDGGPALRATFRRPHVLAFDDAGNLVIGDSFNHRIRRVDAATGIITTIAGTGENGVSPIGTPAAAASFRYFGAIVADRSGGLIVSEWGNDRIIRLAPPNMEIEPVAGAHGPEQPPAGSALGARVRFPADIAIDGEGNIWFTESDVVNRLGRVRKIDAKSGAVTTIAGNV